MYVSRESLELKSNSWPGQSGERFLATSSRVALVRVRVCVVNACESSNVRAWVSESTHSWVATPPPKRRVPPQVSCFVNIVFKKTTSPLFPRQNLLLAVKDVKDEASKSPFRQREAV